VIVALLMAVTAIVASAFSCRVVCCRKRQIQATVFYNADAVAVVAVGQPVTAGQELLPGALSNCPPPRYEEIIVGLDH